MENKTKVNYKKLYTDIIITKFPEKLEKCIFFLEKKKIHPLDIIDINNFIFGIKVKKTESFNKKHRSYNKDSIFKILEYQKKNKLNNSQLAKHFGLSRNTVAKWKKLYII